MQCFRCGGDVIWSGDHDEEYDDGREGIVSNLICTECDAFYLMYWGQGEED